jgi:ornithine cyclodeaminase
MNASTLPVRPTAQTLFLSATDAAKAIQNFGVAASLRGMVDAIYADFLRWNEFDKCPRLANHSTDGVIELMPVSDARTYAFKYVNGHPTNHRFHLPTVMAFGVLADVDTGLPDFLCELTLTTALRTAATSVMAARALARGSSNSMSIIGNGAQSEFQALAFHHVLGIEEIRLFDNDPAATQKLLRNLQHVPLQFKVCGSIAECVQGADIVTTITADKTNATILNRDMITPGMHINGVGGDCPGKTELHPDVLKASRVYVEFEPQTRIEGDLQHLPKDFAVTELWQVLQNPLLGRTSDADITLFDSVGFALEDFSALRFMRSLALQLGLGTYVSLVPSLEDPKDLFSLIKPARHTTTSGA